MVMSLCLILRSFVRFALVGRYSMRLPPYPQCGFRSGALLYMSLLIRPSSYSNAKMRFQSFFMLIVHACFFAMSYIAWLKVSRPWCRGVPALGHRRTHVL